jgi:hypothetical protein
VNDQSNIPFIRTAFYRDSHLDVRIHHFITSTFYFLFSCIREQPKIWLWIFCGILFHSSPEGLVLRIVFLISVSWI